MENTQWPPVPESQRDKNVSEQLGGEVRGDADDPHLFNQRARADEATGRERSKVDEAIDRERSLKRSIVNELLNRERAQTDRNLLDERERTDAEVRRVSGLLSDELASHAKTRVSLTTRDEFLAIVSHDLRNPIGAVSSCAQMLIEDADYKMDAETRSWIEFIKRNADSALRLISDLMDIERIAEGKLGLQMGRHALAQIIREAFESFVYVASAKNVLLRLQPLADLGEIECDRDRIVQILSNLIGNAIKFTPEGGAVVLEARSGENEVQISVCDNGPGIPEDKRERIFDRFAQIGSKDRRGLGLGLYISKMLIMEHRGRIWLESTVGQGSRFFIALPRRQ